MLWVRTGGESEFDHDFLLMAWFRGVMVMSISGAQNISKSWDSCRTGCVHQTGRRWCWRWLSMESIDEWMGVSIDR